MESCNWCFTLNNPSFEAWSLVLPAEHVKYCVWQLERVTTLHIQGYLELKKKARLTAIPRRIPMLAGAHFEKRRGTAQEASDYCEKDESREEGD